MARMKTCKCGCKQKAAPDDGVTVKMAWFISIDHAVKHGRKLADKAKKKALAKQKAKQKLIEKAERKKHKQRKKEVKPLKYWQDNLQKLVNQYVVHIRDKGKPCCTCGTDAPDIKYDAGHYRTRASAPELRYELTNIHKQCSINCNVHGSGMRLEYQGFIVKHYGDKHLEWINGMHPLLKETFPHWSDYEAEIKRYRKLIREHGLKPAI